MSEKNIKLKKQIESLSFENQIEIYNIFKKHDICITENNNGSFINISNIQTKVLDEIQNYIEYVKNQEIELEKTENEKICLQKFLQK